MDTLQTNRQTPIETVVNVTTKVEIVLSDIACLGAVERVVFSIDVSIIGITCLRINTVFHHAQAEFVDHTDTITAVKLVVHALDVSLTILR